jgi:predicted metal-dependent peptidase
MMMTEETKKFDLNRHTARLLMQEPFFAALSRRIDKKASTAIPTAGVRVNPDSGQFEMVYNPNFFATLSDAHRAGVLKHEFYHLIFEHVTGRLPEEGMSKKWNFATDLAINSNLRNELPEGALIPGEGHFADLPVGKSAEWYFANLPDADEGEGEGESEGGQGEGEEGDGEGSGDGEGQEENNDSSDGQGEGEGEGEGEGSGSGQGEGEPTEGEGSGSGQGQPQEFDDHSGWGETDNTTNEIAKQRLKETLKQAAQEASKAGSWGTVGADTRQDILDRLTAKVDWKKVLRYFIKTSQRANKSSTIKRINRRYAYIHPGRKVNRTASIAISIDQSGSVDNGMLAAFFTELNKLSKLAEFTVIPFDTDVSVENVYVWKKGETKKWERVTCGGTCFEAPTDYVNERQFDGHIILTDLCAPKPKASKCQRMWMTTEYYAKHPYFQTNERIVAIEDQ